jgi:hypothetical protein
MGHEIVGTFPNVEFAAFPDGLGHAVHILELLDTLERRYIESWGTPVVIEVDLKTYDPENRMVNLTLTMNNDSYSSDLQGTYWYHVMVTEDNIIKPHSTWPHCSTPNTPPHEPQMDMLYVNDWVTRKLIYLSEGRYLVGPTWPYHQEITISDTFSIDHAWVSENCNIVVNVYKKVESLYQSPVMQAIKIPVMGSSGLSDGNFKENELITIFPNPATNMTNIHFSLLKNGTCSLDIYDFKGQNIKNLLHGNIRKGIYNVELQTNEIPSGTYLLVLETSKGTTSEKLIIL